MRKKDEITELAREAGWSGDEPKTIAEAISLLVSASSAFDTEVERVYPHGVMSAYVVEPHSGGRSGVCEVEYPDFLEGDDVRVSLDHSDYFGVPDIGEGTTTLELAKDGTHTHTIVFDEATNSAEITVVSDSEPGLTNDTVFQFSMMRRVTKLNAKLEALIKELMDSYKPAWYKG